MDRKEFLKEYHQAAINTNSGVDVALANLLIAFDDQIAYLYDTPEFFHKAFRQVDVVNIPGIDSAIWNLLYDSKLFWEIFDKKTKINESQKENQQGNIHS